MKILTTQIINGQIIENAQLQSLHYDKEGIERLLLNLYPQIAFQTILGFGGAMTEAAGSVLCQLPEGERQKIIESYYGKDGLGYTLIRTHMDSCDFSLGNYCADDVPGDIEFAHFSLERDNKHIIPFLKEIKRISEDFKLFMAPWSPPAYMKTNNNRNGGGELKPEYYRAWARYLAHYIKEYEKAGLPVFCVSTQNEPKAVQTWDSCVYSAEQERDFILNHLRPALNEEGITPLIMIWDHNKERMLERSELIIDDKTNGIVGAIGFHWYSGDHVEAMSLTHKRFPDKLLISTEACVEYSRHAREDAHKHAAFYAHDIIGGLNNGMHGFIDWNLVLDEKGGPNHVGNYCEAPIMCDTKEGKWYKNASWYFIKHFSKYIRPGAKRIGHSLYTSQLEACAFVNPDGSIVTVVHNPSREEIPYKLRVHGHISDCTAKPQSISTIII